MHIILFDRSDRLGSNMFNYISQILFAHKNGFIIKYHKDKSNYQYSNSVFVIPLFNYIDNYNEKLYILNTLDESEVIFSIRYDLMHTASVALKTIKMDFVSYFNYNIYNDIKIDFDNLTNNYIVPFDVNKTILVHLRLEDVASHQDYDGLESSEFYKKKILNNEECYTNSERQAPLSKTKIENIINKAKEEFKDYRVILITAPDSDTSFLDYEVIKNNNENLDLYLLTMCTVVILSRSTFALTSLFFNNNKQKIYAPLWAHFICCGFDTIYDNIDKSKIEYFY